MKKRFFNIILYTGINFLCFPRPLAAQDSLSIHELLRHIQQQQVLHDVFFMPGIFPSYFSKEKLHRYEQKDNNSYYTALIVYTLKTLRPGLAEADQTIVDSIAARSEKTLARFKNRKGRESYNYWRTDSAYRFPFIRCFRLTKKNILADDPDCTSLCLLALKGTDSIAKEAHRIMQAFTNNTRHPTHTTSSRYKSYAAYSGWLWKNMPVVFDICAVSNILSFVQSYNLQWTRADSASLNLVIATITNKDYINNPIRISPYYGSTSVILYHLSRLMSIKPIPVLEAMKNVLINEALKQLQKTNDDLEKIILSNALLKWNYNAPFPALGKIKDIEDSNLPFVIANIPSFTGFTIQKALTKRGIGLFYYYCPAYNDVLLLEDLELTMKIKN